jgi:hypothetical protein
MAIVQQCGTSFSNTGNKGCIDKSDLAPIVGLIVTTEGFSFSSTANFATEATWEAGIKAGTVFPIPDVVEYDIEDEDTQLYESPLGKQTVTRKGNYRTKFRFNKNLCSVIALQSFSNQNARVFYVHDDGNISGYSPDGAEVKGFSLDLLYVEKQKKPEAGTPGFVPVQVSEKNSKEWNEYGVLINPTWEAIDLRSLTDVDISVVGSPTSSLLTLQVVSTCGLTSAGVANTVTVAGILEADFLILNGSGAAQTTTGFTDNGDGTYTWTATATIVTGTGNLVAPASLTSTKLMIESTGAASFTVA